MFIFFYTNIARTIVLFAIYFSEDSFFFSSFYIPAITWHLRQVALLFHQPSKILFSSSTIIAINFHVGHLCFKCAFRDGILVSGILYHNEINGSSVVRINFDNSALGQHCFHPKSDYVERLRC